MRKLGSGCHFEAISPLRQNQDKTITCMWCISIAKTPEGKRKKKLAKSKTVVCHRNHPFAQQRRETFSVLVGLLVLFFRYVVISRHSLKSWYITTCENKAEHYKRVNISQVSLTLDLTISLILIPCCNFKKLRFKIFSGFFKVIICALKWILN